MQAQYVSHYLSDRDVANFARQSFAKVAENFTEAQNNQLIRFLARGMSSPDWEKLIHRMVSLGQMDCAEQAAKELAVYMRNIPEHWVPFGHPQITLRMKAPVPIRVQCFKHKIGFVESEESRRYISTKPEIYIPPFFRAKAENVKQGSGDAHPRSEYWLTVYKNQCDQAVQLYEDMILAGVCPEQARFVLPQGAQVNWVWTGSLYAYANFFNQRSDSHAQKEVQDLAQQVNQIIAPLFPVSWAALTQGDY
jgi:thymidylate synthase (FAD)